MCNGLLKIVQEEDKEENRITLFRKNNSLAIGTAKLTIAENLLAIIGHLTSSNPFTD